MWHALGRDEMHTRIWWGSLREETTCKEKLRRWQDDIKMHLEETG
jgi:hypothetical protein